MSSLSNAKTESTATFLTSLWFNGAIFAAELLIFTIVRTKFVDVYEPRTKTRERNKTLVEDDGKYVDKDYTPFFYKHFYSWPLHVIMLPTEPIKYLNGFDAYAYVFFLHLLCIIFLPIWLISWAVLLPVDAVNSKTGKTGLDMFTFGNVSQTHQVRYAAHVALAFLFTAWTLYVISEGMEYFIKERQLFLAGRRHRESAQARTVLITGIEEDYLSEKALTDLFSILPGGVQKVWLNRDLKDLPAKYKERRKLCNKLEKAENKLIRVAVKRHHKFQKKGTDEEKGQTSLEALVPDNKRPQFRHPLKFMPFSLPLVGKKEDTINWASTELRRVNYEVKQRQRIARNVAPFPKRNLAKRDWLPWLGTFMKALLKGKPSSASVGSGWSHSTGEISEEERAQAQLYPSLSSAFILFRQQIAAHMCVQSLSHHEAFVMSQRYIEIAPPDIIWRNLGLSALTMRYRRVISYGITLGLIVLWAIPVAFLGAVSNVANLCATYHWLSWLCKLPSTVIGILQGVLPPALLAILNMLLPIVLRMLAKFEGIPTRSGVELSLMTRYFIFNVIHSFLIVTLSSGIIAALPGLVKNPGSIPSLLAASLPQASNFFLTYILLQGLAVAANAFLQIVALLVYLAKLFFLGTTPRSLYNVRYQLSNVKWGTLFPVTTLVAVIAIAYSIISPIVNGLACATFYLFYLAYKYLFTYRLDQPKSGDTGGLFFPKAIHHIFVGLYIQQICLAALFFLARNASDKPSAIVEGALMVVLLGITVFVHTLVVERYGPLIHSLPLTFQDGIPPHLVDSGLPPPSIAGIDHRKRAIEADGEEQMLLDRTASGNESSSSHQGHAKKQEEETDDGLFKFAHPSIKDEQPVIWIPRDDLGIWEGEMAKLQKPERVDFSEKMLEESNLYNYNVEDESSIWVSTNGDTTRMNEKGRVELTSDRNPPEDNERLYLP